LIAAAAPLMRDAVIAGINRDEIAALVILDLDGCRVINPALPADDVRAAASDPIIRRAVLRRLVKFQEQSTGSSTRIRRAVLLDTPLSIDCGEVTDKGSVNQRAVLEHRAALVDLMYSDPLAAQVILLDGSSCVTSDPA
jgi:feruloyl-CoA synthase